MPTLDTPPADVMNTPPDAPTGGLPQATPAEEFGLTDALDPWIAKVTDRTGVDGLAKALAVIDRKASIRVTGDAIELRGVLRTRRLSLDHVRGLEIETPLSVLGRVVPFWQGLLWLVPGARLGKAVRLAANVAPRFMSDPEPVEVDDLDRPVIATIRRVGPNVRLRGAAALVALVHPRLTQRLLEEAERRSLPVHARR